jgi:hypothetical protein
MTEEQKTDLMPRADAPGTALAAPSTAAMEETRAVLEMISRAASDATIDIEKMDRLLAMQERMLAKQARTEFTAAFAAMQPELPSIKERGAIRNKANEVQSTYALWEDINEVIKPVLQRHGFALAFRSTYPNGGVCVTGVLRHVGGHEETTEVILPFDLSGSKNATQAVGSSLSYGKRYAATQLLNLTSHGEDDDAQQLSEPEKIVIEWRQTIAECKTQAELQDRRAELIEAYRGASNVPEELKVALQARKKELR